MVPSYRLNFKTTCWQQKLWKILSEIMEMPSARNCYNRQINSANTNFARQFSKGNVSNPYDGFPKTDHLVNYS